MEAAPQQPEQQQPPEQQQQQQKGPDQHSVTQADPGTVQKLGNCKLVSSSGGKRVWECPDFCGRPCIIKQTQQAAAKHPLLDRKLATKPCQQDVAGLCRARKAGVAAPTPYHVHPGQGLVFCAKVEGVTLQQRLSEVQQLDEATEQLLSDLGKLLARLHNGGVVHGALSSSSVLVRPDSTLVLQDFECFMSSNSPLHKAADLVVLDADLQQQHPPLPGLFDKVVASYNKLNKQWSATFNRLSETRNMLQKHQQGRTKKQRTQ